MKSMKKSRKMKCGKKMLLSRKNLICKIKDVFHCICLATGASSQDSQQLFHNQQPKSQKSKINLCKKAHLNRARKPLQNRNTTSDIQSHQKKVRNQQSNMTKGELLTTLLLKVESVCCIKICTPTNLFKETCCKKNLPFVNCCFGPHQSS